MMIPHMIGLGITSAQGGLPTDPCLNTANWSYSADAMGNCFGTCQGQVVQVQTGMCQQAAAAAAGAGSSTLVGDVSSTLSGAAGTLTGTILGVPVWAWGVAALAAVMFWKGGAQ